MLNPKAGIRSFCFYSFQVDQQHKTFRYRGEHTTSALFMDADYADPEPLLENMVL